MQSKQETDQKSYENLQEGSAEDGLYDIVAVSAEDHAHVYFTGAAFKGIGGDAVKAGSGKDEGENGYGV
jgi:hypothetical protein